MRNPSVSHLHVYKPIDIGPSPLFLLQEGTCPSPHLSLFPPALLSFQWPYVISCSLSILHLQFLFVQYFPSAFKHTHVSSILKDTKTTSLRPHVPLQLPCQLSLSLHGQFLGTVFYFLTLSSPPRSPQSGVHPHHSADPSNLCTFPLLCRSCTKFTNDRGRCISWVIWSVSSFHFSTWHCWLCCLLEAFSSVGICIIYSLGFLLPFRFLFLILPSGLNLFHQTFKYWKLLRLSSRPPHPLTPLCSLGSIIPFSYPGGSQIYISGPLFWAQDL